MMVQASTAIRSVQNTRLPEKWCSTQQCPDTQKALPTLPMQDS